jgi:arylformamidase
VKPYIANGIRVVSVDYELCPNVTLEEITNQIKNCFQWIANYVTKNSIKRIVIAGHSAGSHLLCYAMNENFLTSIGSDVAIDCLFLSGVYYLDELRYLKAANDGNILCITDENVQKLSPYYHDFNYLRNFNVKIHIYAGEHESNKFQEQSKKFAENTMNDLTTTFKIINTDHFSIVENLASPDYELTSMIINTLKN